MKKMIKNKDDHNRKNSKSNKNVHHVRNSLFNTIRRGDKMFEMIIQPTKIMRICSKNYCAMKKLKMIKTQSQLQNRLALSAAL